MANERNAGRKKIDSELKKLTKSIQLTPIEIKYIEENGDGKSFSDKVISLIFKDSENVQKKLEEIKKIIDEQL